MPAAALSALAAEITACRACPAVSPRHSWRCGQVCRPAEFTAIFVGVLVGGPAGEMLRAIRGGAGKRPGAPIRDSDPLRAFDPSVDQCVIERRSPPLLAYQSRGCYPGRGWRPRAPAG